MKENKKNASRDDLRVGHLEAMISPLLTWHSVYRRPLPWRMTRDPYAIWISEVMLQQTRIEAVIPYYRRFMAAFPNVFALAEADDDHLMKLWQGLGYYSRARNLKKAAAAIVTEHGGRFPEETAALCRLPGIGDYTAGAISSLAFGRPSPAVDGNVLRVIMRYLACSDDVMLPATKREVTSYLSAVYPMGDDAAAFTEGLMELGELICLPNGAPKCEACPLRLLCRGYGEGDPTKYPTRSGKKERRIEEKTMLLLRCGERYAICRRPDKGLLAGLWELPSLPGRMDAKAIERLFHGAAITPMGDAKHIFTHIEWHMTGYEVVLPRETDSYTWAGAEEIKERYAIPTAYRAYAEKIR